MDRVKASGALDIGSIPIGDEQLLIEQALYGQCIGFWD